MNSKELIERTTEFAHRCVKLSTSLPNSDLGRHIKQQLIRCSTSVAANYRASVLGQSKASFIAKLSIVLEETDESVFWIEFLLKEKLLSEQLVKSLLTEANELKAIFYSARKTLKSKQY